VERIDVLFIKVLNHLPRREKLADWPGNPYCRGWLVQLTSL